MPDGGSFIGRLFADAVRPVAPIQVSAWADKHRRLTAKGASEPGPWRTSRVPFLREIMDCLSATHPCKEVCFVKSTQVGGTEVGLNWIGYVMDHAPGPMLAVLPTVEVGQRWSKQRLASMIAASPVLSRLIAPSASRDGGNTNSMKEFAGDGMLIIGGANSAASLSSMPIKYLLLDEVDRFPIEVEDEGDPVDLAEARTTTFPRRKIFKISSPTIESLSRINKDWKRSDQRRFHVPCPHCGTHQALQWENLQWPDGDPAKAAYRCNECSTLIEEHHKTAMLEAGQWIAAHPGSDMPGFHINALYTPIGLGKTWAEHAKRFLEVKSDPVRLKVFTNTVLGECFEDADEKLDWEEIKSRAEPYKLREVPAGCLILTAGVDVQKDRFEVIVRGFGENAQRWTIDWHYIPADPTREDEWQKLDDYLAQPFTNRWGISMKLAAVGVDSGNWTHDVYNYTRARRHKNIYAVKGVHQFGRQLLSRPTRQDFKRNGGVIKGGAELYTVASTTAKQHLYARLASDGRRAQHDRVEHFSADLEDDFYQQLTAEIFDPNKRLYVKLKDRRNEALDGTNYAEAIAHHPCIRIHAMRELHWKQLRQAFEPGGAEQGDLFQANRAETPQNTAETAPPDAKPAETSPLRPRIVPRKGGFVNRFKK